MVEISESVGSPILTLTPGVTEFDVPGFIDALARAAPEDRRAVKQFLNTAFIDDDQAQPSPRAKEVVESGEWEKSDVSLVRLDSLLLGRICRSRIGDGSPPRFCVADGDAFGDGVPCSVASHLSSKRVSIQPGYYISTGGGISTRPRQGIYSEPYIPLGAPFVDNADAALSDAINPFELSIGQWKYVMNEIKLYRQKVSDLRPQQDKEPTLATLTERMQALRVNLEKKEETVEFDSADSVQDESVSTPLRVDTSHPQDDRTLGLIRDLEAQVNYLKDEVDRERKSRMELEKNIELAMVAVLGVGEKITRRNAADAGAMEAEVKSMVASEIASRSLATTVQVQGVRDSAMEATERIRSDLNALDSGVMGLRNALYDPRGLLSSVREEIREIGDRVDHGGITYNATVFSSPKEFVKWVKVKHPAHQDLDYGLFQDIFSMWHLLAGSSVTHVDSLKTEHDAQKVNYKSQVQAKLSTSYETTIPDIFGSSDSSGYRFGSSMSTHNKWLDPATHLGLSTMIREEMEAQVRALKDLIEDNLGGIPDLKALAIEMLSDTKAFHQDLVSFLEEFHTELREASGIHDKEAWQITRAIFEQIIREVRIARNDVRYTRKHEPSLHIWGALKAHMVMKRFKDAHFRDDPSLVGILISSILKQQKEADGGNLLKKFNALSQSFTKLEKYIKDNVTKKLEGLAQNG